MNLCDINTIRAVLQRHGFHFSKSLGQNFLINAETLRRTADASGAAEFENVVEIGPGMGCLTAELCQRAKHVAAIELDRALFPVLEETLAAYTNVTLIQGDALAMDLRQLCMAQFGEGKAVACANLPYYITTPAITALLDSRAFERITVMVQKEVAQRVCAVAGTAAYSAFSLYVQYRAATELLFEVSANCFTPRPKVDSAVLQLTPFAAPPVSVRDEKLLFALIRAAFNMRRKTLANALGPVLGSRMEKADIAALLETVGLDTRIRGERLSLADFARLADTVSARLESENFDKI